jgi:hypothetical protein
MAAKEVAGLPHQHVKREEKKRLLEYANISVLI